MLNTFLNIVGLIFIIISIIIIKKTSKKETAIYKEILLIEDNIKSYSLSIENILNNFDELIDSSLSKLEFMEKQNEEPFKVHDSYFMENKTLLEEDNAKEDYIDTIYDEIIKLNKIGLSNEEIAKKLNIGIREVEVFLKIWKNK
jgi:Na+/phosphate symporter